MKKIYDISRIISNEALVYPGDDSIELSYICDIDEACPCRITRLGGWSTHFLTHVDAPRHFHLDGPTLDQIPLHRFTGRSRVISLRCDAIDAEVVSKCKIQKNENVLFKTRHSGPFVKDVFDKSHVHITKSGADALVESGANAVGVDYLSVDRYGDDTYPAHRTLLGSGIIILEAADFSSVSDGEYQLIALPLKISEGDGSPVRAILTDL
jgi:arylformamidase